MATSGSFREDLWFRINVITCKLPPLRARRDEIPALLERLAGEAAARMGLGAPSLSGAAKAAAQQHAWPGNFRELINRVERAVALGSGSTLTEADLFPEGAIRAQDTAAPQASAADPGTPLADVRDAAEKAHIIAALAQAEGSASAAAASLGISRSTLWEKMRRLGISRDEEG
ncbi:helix-turn-helix domain-containing protein [Pannonibacter phragmitetus]|uniref:helix-turn-helix domain-containing protein n=1 Tax=Pannonibacter phragmitetus TaxID=121719 RepID=UPI003D2F49AF